MGFDTLHEKFLLSLSHDQVLRDGDDSCTLLAAEISSQDSAIAQAGQTRETPDKQQQGQKITVVSLKYIHSRTFLTL